ncbi:MAG: hypothetical protein ACRBCJ_10985 [Hyphomicrobiaceae bacterium]
MDWLSNITVDTTIVFGVIVLAAVLTYRQRKPTASSTLALRKKLKTATSALPKKNATREIKQTRLYSRLRSLLQWRPTFTLNVMKKLALAPVSATVAEVPANGSLEPLSRAKQWDCVTGVVTRAIDGASSVERWQQAAEDQLDAATYAINGLLDELLPVMPQSFGQSRQFAPISAAASRPAIKPSHHVADNENRPTAAMLALAAYGSVAA